MMSESALGPKRPNLAGLRGWQESLGPNLARYRVLGLIVPHFALNTGKYRRNFIANDGEMV